MVEIECIVLTRRLVLQLRDACTQGDPASQKAGQPAARKQIRLKLGQYLQVTDWSGRISCLRNRPQSTTKAGGGCVWQWTRWISHALHWLDAEVIGGRDSLKNVRVGF